MFDKRKAIEETYSQFWNIHDEYKGLSLDELKIINQNDRLPFGVCIINLTGDLNVGMMMRTACLMGAERFIIFGRKRYDKRSTVGAQNYIDVIRVGGMIDDTRVDVVKFDSLMKEYDYVPVMFENTGTDTELDKFNVFTRIHPLKPCLVFGNEGFGLPPELLSHNYTVSIPQRGVLRSLNVSSAAAIAMYEIAKQLT